MSQKFTDRTRKAMAHANEEARRFNHEYIGTEHLLLGLVAEDTGVAADVLKTLGVDIAAVRREIEKLVDRGPIPVTMNKLPLTPRAQAALEFASQEARNVNQKVTDTEHLLLGLLREPDGVAGRVLRALNVKPEVMRAEVLKVRIELMKIVERAVRPLRAGTPRKRKMREELLAHLTAIYEEDLSRLNDPAAAMKEAATRFGDPTDLAYELGSALPFHKRINYFMERFVLYRAPETAAHFSLRMAVHTFFLLAIILGLVQGGVILRYGWIEDVKTLARVLGAIVVLTPLCQFVVWHAYIKMRDALWGAFGSRKSFALVLLLDALIAAVAASYLLGITSVTRLDLGAAIEAGKFCGLIGLLTSIAFLGLARFSGPSEIRDTLWALLDIEAA